MSEKNHKQIPGMSELLAVIRTLVGELHPHWKNLHFLPDTHLERELGLDSMARAELHTRIEQTLNISMSEQAAICATSADDLMQAITNQATGHASATTETGTSAADLLMGEFGTADDSQEPDRHTLPEWLYALYAWPIFFLVAVTTWILLIVIPVESWRRKAAHWCARLAFAFTFIPLKVKGSEHLDPLNPQIIAANHVSYLDGFIITAALDIPIHFIVKGELASVALVRILLQRFGVEFVDRFNASKGTSDVNRIAEKSRNGMSIVFFPEGTFTTFEGLQPFRMGAFVTAARANVPVIPVAINGARNIVRSNNWFPHRGKIQVTIRPAIQSGENGWKTALDLRDATRKEIAPYTGEVDLVEE